MESLRKKLQQEIHQQPDQQIQQSVIWGLPVQLVKVRYTTIKRTTMDILMKMILLTIQKLEVSDPKVVADFLAVEPLFIEDLVNRMQLTNMIRQRKEVFELTQVGVEQLQAGIYEHPAEKKEKNFYYSACHHAILCEEQEKPISANITPFRLAKKQINEIEDVDQEQWRDALLSAGAETTEGSLQMVLDNIETPTSIDNLLIPCVEFSVYNRVEKLYVTRVWNTLLQQWDERLEKLIDEVDPLKKKR
ncbi:hypothetical protein [Sporosarcina obsidiansis]|uniref:hypothetical protein n=1 Tax=Sporosarcina obsidiansis TaxID=2660748 RepID=UPI00129B5B2E|nr:hypothetical protein [Sporosarcina obsidiansis]